MNGTPWSAKEIQFLKDNYLKITGTEIARQLGRTGGAVRAKASLLGIKKGRRWTDEETALLKKLYPTTLNKEIAQKIGRSAVAVRNRAVVVSAPPKRFIRRRYRANDSTFSDYSDETFYWLGFFAADGCIVSEHTLQFSLSIGDRQQVEKFRSFLQSDNRIYYNDKEARLMLTSPEIVARLAHWGITERKSKTIQFPNLPDQYIRPFLLGYSDGDGSLGVYLYHDKKRNYVHHRAYFSICSGNKDFVTAYRANLLAGGTIKTRAGIYHKRPGTYSFRLGDRPAAQAIAWLYSEWPDYCLPRKRERAQEVIRLSRERGWLEGVEE